MDIINTARLKSVDWPEAQHEIAAEVVSNKFDHCEERLEIDYDIEATQKKAENNDRVLLQIASAKRHFQRQLESRESALQKLINSGNSNLIKATEAQIRKVRERFEQREAELKIHQDFSHRMDDVCHLVLKVI